MYIDEIALKIMVYSVIAWGKETWYKLANKTNLIIFIIVFLTLSSEVWVSYLLGFIFGNAWLIGFGNACWLFWLAPLTPFVPLCFTITFAIRKVFDKIKQRNIKKWLL